MKNLILATFLRFLRVFVTTGLAQVLIIIVAHPLENLSIESFKVWVAILITAFVSGGLAGLDKAIRFKEEKAEPTQ